MKTNKLTPVRLDYGKSGQFLYEIETVRLAGWHEPPEPLDDVAAAVRQALAEPLDFPPMSALVYPQDRVVLALDRSTPEAATVVAELWRVCEQRSVRPRDVCILQPASWEGAPVSDPRSQLPPAVAREIRWKVHDPTARSSHVYLASTSLGERIYLSRDLVDADVVIPVGRIAFDSVIGYRGTGSVIYPGLSTVEAMARAHGQGHRELEPDDVRPLRQMIDEIAWLLGVQFAVQLIPARAGGACHVLAGAVDSVFRRGREALKKAWHVQVKDRADVVVLAVEADAGGHGWPQLGTALQAARNVVKAGGKIIVLTELEEQLGAGMRLICDADNPRDALRPLRLASPPDLVPATQLLQATDWAKVYLLSRMKPEVVEDLFMVPLSRPEEAARLLADEPQCVFLGAAQHTHASVLG